MSGLIIPSGIPASIVVVSQESMGRIADLTKQAGEIPVITTADEFRAADAIVSEVVKLTKEIEAERARIKRPIIDLGRALDEAASEATAGLVAIKARLGKRLMDFQAEENRRREEARREMERQRIAAETEARRIAAEVAAQQAQERERQKAAALAEESAADDGTPPWESPESETVKAPEVVHVPTVLPPSYDQQQSAAPLKSSAVVAKTIKRVEIVSPDLVPDEIAGVKLWILDTKTIEKLAKSGVQIPGVIVSEVSSIAAKG